jgi:hypothetical protein
MTEAPRLMDSAVVIAFVQLDPAIHKDTGALRLYADGALQSGFHGLAIATYDLESFYLFFCDENWETENDTFHDSVSDAIDTAERKFGLHLTQWHFYHEELRPA